MEYENKFDLLLSATMGLGKKDEAGKPLNIRYQISNGRAFLELD